MTSSTDDLLYSKYKGLCPELLERENWLKKTNLLDRPAEIVYIVNVRLCFISKTVKKKNVKAFVFYKSTWYDLLRVYIFISNQIAYIFVFCFKSTCKIKQAKS